MDLVQKKNFQTDLYILNWIRGACAILVVLGHARVFGWRQGLPSDMWSNGISRIILSPSSLGMESVSVFFVISGYLVGGQTYNQITDGSFLWRRFLVDRMTRLYIVLIPGMLFTWLCFRFSQHIGNKSPSSNFELEKFLCNVIFLMPTRCEPYGNNSSLWSLGYEFYFYLLFAAACTFFQREKRYITRVFFFCLILTITISFTPALFILFPAWLLGAFAYYLETQILDLWLNQRKNSIFFVGLFLLIISFLISNLLSLNENFTILFISLPASIFIIAMAQISKRINKPSSIGITLLDYFGKTSYSIYVFHLPIILLFFNFYSSLQGILGIIQIYLVGSITIIFSSLAYFFFEKYTKNFRLFVYERLHIITVR